MFGKAVAAISASARNPAALLDWAISEGVQEIAPLLTGVGVGRAVTGAAKLALGERIASKYGVAAAVGESNKDRSKRSARIAKQPPVQWR